MIYQAMVPATHIRDVTIETHVEIVSSGFRAFDKFQLLKKDRSELIIVGARPGMGKSALMFQIAANLARTSNVLIFSLEMDKESIVRRLLAKELGSNIKKLSDAPKQEVRAATARLHALNLHIDDRSGLSIATIATSAMAMHTKNPLSLVVVDYLQLMRSRDMGNRNNEIGEITAGLKALAKQLKIPIIVGSQLSRECEKRGKDKRSGNLGDFIPILSDLRDSGNIEQDADIICFLSREEVYNGNRPGVADFRIAKHRNGETGDFRLDFSKALTAFFDPPQDLL
jgi:replicative DNA helicase